MKSPYFVVAPCRKNSLWCPLSRRIIRIIPSISMSYMWLIIDNYDHYYHNYIIVSMTSICIYVSYYQYICYICIIVSMTSIYHIYIIIC